MKDNFQRKNILNHNLQKYKQLQQVRHKLKLDLSQLLIQQYIQLLVKLQHTLVAKNTMLHRINKSELTLRQ